MQQTRGRKEIREIPTAWLDENLSTCTELKDSGKAEVILATSYWKANLAFGAIIILSILAIVLFEIIVLIEKIVCPWYGSEKQHYKLEDGS